MTYVNTLYEIQFKSESGDDWNSIWEDSALGEAFPNRIMYPSLLEDVPMMRGIFYHEKQTALDAVKLLRSVETNKTSSGLDLRVRKIIVSTEVLWKSTTDEEGKMSRIEFDPGYSLTQEAINNLLAQMKELAAINDESVHSKADELLCKTLEAIVCFLLYDEDYQKIEEAAALYRAMSKWYE